MKAAEEAVRKDGVSETGKEGKEGKDENSWLDPRLKREIGQAPLRDQKLMEEAMTRISQQEGSGALKNADVEFLLRELESSSESDALKLVKSRPASWRKKRKYAEAFHNYALQMMEKFRMSGLMACVSAMLMTYFMNSVIYNHYVVNFSVDALIGAAAAVYLFFNLRSQIRTVSQFDAKARNRYLLLDVLALLLVICLRLLVPQPYDLSLIVYVVTYFIEKKWFEKAVEKAEGSLPDRFREKKGSRN